MKEFLKRTLFGFIFLVLVVSTILYSSLAFCILMGVVVCIGCYEMSQLASASKSNKCYTFWICFFGLLSYILIAIGATISGAIKSFFFIPLVFMLPFLFALYDKKNSIAELTAAFWIPMFSVVIPSGIMICIHNTNFLHLASGATIFSHEANGFSIGSCNFPLGTELLLFILALVWINDIFAYLVGVTIGRHRLFERISPKKSWEGSIGGLVFTLFASGLYCHFKVFLPMHIGLIIALLIVVFGSFGDLVESMLKRHAGVKDSGKIIPGHGGILDRFDAAFFAIPFVFVYLMII
ncbi:MAG: phosphatidate cytidylyltransferase [Lentimicrobiaceae bacterium]|nr:phosphatidate cytidylyltransferase [Lentimicrobiaceae bacterium]